MTAADLYAQMVSFGKLVEMLYMLAGQLRADKNSALEYLDAMPPMATDLRIGPPDYLDWTNVAANLEQLKAEIDGGGCVIIEIGKIKPRACYWLVGVDIDNDTVTVKKKRVGTGVSEEILLFKSAAQAITGRYLLAKHGA